MNVSLFYTEQNEPKEKKLASLHNGWFVFFSETNLIQTRILEYKNSHQLFSPNFNKRRSFQLSDKTKN